MIRKKITELKQHKTNQHSRTISKRKQNGNKELEERSIWGNERRLKKCRKSLIFKNKFKSSRKQRRSTLPAPVSHLEEMKMMFQPLNPYRVNFRDQSNSSSMSISDEEESSYISHTTVQCQSTKRE